jgi:hypothetical protein
MVKEHITTANKKLGLANVDVPNPLYVELDDRAQTTRVARKAKTEKKAAPAKKATATRWK